MEQRYEDHLVVTKDYGCAVRNIAKREGRELGFTVEMLLNKLPEVQEEIKKIRGKK